MKVRGEAWKTEKVKRASRAQTMIFTTKVVFDRSKVANTFETQARAKGAKQLSSLQTKNKQPSSATSVSPTYVLLKHGPVSLSSWSSSEARKARKARTGVDAGVRFREQEPVPPHALSLMHQTNQRKARE